MQCTILIVLSKGEIVTKSDLNGLVSHCIDEVNAEDEDLDVTREEEEVGQSIPQPIAMEI